MSEETIEIDRETALGVHGLARAALLSDDVETHETDLENVREFAEEIAAEGV